MRQHRLHREIVTTVVVNTFVDTAGITCFHRLSTETGATAPDLIRAHIAARTIFGAADLEAAVAALDHAVAGRHPDPDAPGRPDARSSGRPGGW